MTCGYCQDTGIIMDTWTERVTCRLCPVGRGLIGIEKDVNEPDDVDELRGELQPSRVTGDE